MNIKRIILLIWIFAVISLTATYVWAEKENGSKLSNKTVFVLSGAPKGQTPLPDDEGTRKIIRQTQILDEAMLLEKRGRYDEAIAKYRESIGMSLLNTERDKAYGIAGIMRVHHKQGKLDMALQELEEWHKLSSSLPPGQLYIDKKPELEALIKARDTGSNEPIYVHIENLKERYKRVLPPKGHQSFVTSQIIRLYDYIGNLDAGIAFVDEALAYKKLIPTAREQYLKMKQAFLEDKTEGTRGRATQVLIQSDYFPW